MKIHFSKYSGCGNDFILIDGREMSLPSSQMVQHLCDRHHGIGADGVIFLLRSSIADLQMKIFNPDGTEADMCGNGIRCFHAFAQELQFPHTLTIETTSGTIYTTTSSQRDALSIDLQSYFVTAIDYSPSLEHESYRIDGTECEWVYSGTQHVVCAVDNVDAVDVAAIGKELRHHETFQPTGTNVNFFHVDGPDLLSVRTFEKGVEKETLACGTGAIATAYIYACKEGGLNTDRKIKIKTRSGEFLETVFSCAEGKVTALQLSGPAHKVFEGDIILPGLHPLEACSLAGSCAN